jgi:hypothetical protein
MLLSGAQPARMLRHISDGAEDEDLILMFA